MASPYLTSKTASLTTTNPVPPSQARAAQIPLQSFVLPTFPPSSFTSGLTSLILTSDIALPSYTSLLSQPFSIPDLPTSITELTLELFSLGFPEGFLGELGRKLGGLRGLTIYSQLFGGTTEGSRGDAVRFVGRLRELKELHLLDVFAPSGVLTELTAALSPELKFLEINYTFRHSDPKFLAGIPAKEILGVLREGLVAVTLGISAPDVTDDEEDREGTEEGMRPVTGMGGALVESLSGAVGGGLVMADLTMFELSLKEVEGVLDACKSVKIFGVSVGLENGWGEVLNIIGKGGRGVNVEQLEIVGVPAEELVERLKGSGELVVENGELNALGERCTGLKSLKVSILRTKMEHWVKDGEEWVKRA